MKKNKTTIKKIIYISSFCFIISFLFTFSFDDYSGNYKSIFKEVCAATDAQGGEEDVVGGKGSKWGDVTGYSYKDWEWIIMGPLVALFRLIGFLISVVMGFIAWTLSPDFTNFYNNAGLKTGWSSVRDFLNIFFIFFLLFSAFATIFQVSKYHIKSTWVMIVVMALLVNFSWPISRVMIDISNVTMSYLIGDKGTSSVTSTGLLSKFGSESQFINVMLGYEDDRKISPGSKVGVKPIDEFLVDLLLAIIAAFLFLVTFTAVAFMLLIRVIMLAILLVFAPVGYVLMAFPSTKSTASEWWNSFTKQLIIGPVLLFCLLIAANTLSGLSLDAPGSVTDNTISGEENTIKVLLKFSVSLCLIWTGILAASKIGGEGSSMVVGKAGAAVRGVGNKLKRGSITGVRGSVRAADYGMAHLTNKASQSDNKYISGAAKGAQKLRHGPSQVKDKFKKGQKNYEDAILESKARASGDENALENLRTKKVNKEVDDQKNTSTTGIVSGLASAQGDKLVASIQTLSKREDMSIDEMKEFTKALKKVKSEYGNESTQAKTVEKQITKKTTETGNAHILKEIGKKPEEIYDGMDAKTMAKQNVYKDFEKMGKSDKNYRATRELVRAANDRTNSFGDKGKQEVLNNASTSNKLARSNAIGRIEKTKAEAKVNAKEKMGHDNSSQKQSKGGEFEGGGGI